jgi:hypothetical protein
MNTVLATANQTYVLRLPKSSDLIGNARRPSPRRVRRPARRHIQDQLTGPTQN